MANNIQYYLNQGDPCPPATSKGGCLKKGNYLSEFETKTEKEIAMNNLGIPDMINNLVDSRVESLIGEISRIWGKFTELTGESYNEIIFTVTPEYYIGENGCDVHILASSGIFEELQLYVNGELISSNKNIGSLDQTIHIDGTSVITCKAKVDGEWHTLSKTITHYDSFWIGAGQSYSDIMTPSNLRFINGGHKANYDISFNRGDKLFIIIGEQIRKYFTRADLNGVELPLEESSIEIDNISYKVLCYEGSWAEGTYNIDINS